MFVSTSDIQRYVVQASDGEAGRVDDLFMRKGEWVILYLLLKAGFEPEGRRVLVPAARVREILHDKETIVLNLTHEEVRESPDVDISQPITEQHEVKPERYYGWPPDWLADEMDITPETEVYAEPEAEPEEGETEYRGPELQRCSELTGVFRVQSNETELGKVIDLIIDDETWLIEHMAVEYAGSPTSCILLPVASAQEVDWTQGYVYLDTSLHDIEARPIWDPQRTAKEQQEQLRVSGGKAG